MTDDLDEMKSRVRHCLVRSVPADLSLQNVSDDTHLFDAAVLDSLSTVALFSEIEKEFQIKLKEEDVFSPSFTTLGGIAELVRERVCGHQ
jgi:acyl carrier protein